MKKTEEIRNQLNRLIYTTAPCTPPQYVEIDPSIKGDELRRLARLAAEMANGLPEGEPTLYSFMTEAYFNTFRAQHAKLAPDESRTFEVLRILVDGSCRNLEGLMKVDIFDPDEAAKRILIDDMLRDITQRDHDTQVKAFKDKGKRVPRIEHRSYNPPIDIAISGRHTPNDLRALSRWAVRLCAERNKLGLRVPTEAEMMTHLTMIWGALKGVHSVTIRLTYPVAVYDVEGDAGE